MSDGQGGTEQVNQHVDRGDGAQLGGAQNAHDDGLGMSTVERARYALMLKRPRIDSPGRNSS